MSDGMIDAISRLFRRKRVPRSDVWITPYVSLMYDDLTPEDVQTRKRIAEALDHYQERMVERHRTMSRHIMRLQQIQAHWNPGTNQIQVYGSGDRSFAWEGPLDRFLGTDILLEAA